MHGQVIDEHWVVLQQESIMARISNHPKVALTLETRVCLKRGIGDIRPHLCCVLTHLGMYQALCQYYSQIMWKIFFHAPSPLGILTLSLLNNFLNVVLYTKVVGAVILLLFLFELQAVAGSVGGARLVLTVLAGTVHTETHLLAAALH